MSAFSQSAFNCIQMAHEQLKRRMLNIHEFKINPRDVFDALVPEADREVLARAKQLGLRSSNYHAIVSLKVNGGSVRVDCEVCAPLPKDITSKSYVLDNTWPFAAEALSWADQMVEINRRFEEGSHVLDLLNDECSSPKQVRYFLPGIVTLLNIGDQDVLANKLSTSTPLRNPPALPAGVRKCVMDYNALIAQASLLPNRPATANGTSFEYQSHGKPMWGEQS